MNLDGCSELENNILSLPSCGLRWCERTAYQLATRNTWVVCTSLEGHTVVKPREFLEFAIDHELPALEFNWRLFSKFKVLG